MSNALAKLVPSSWLVAICSALPSRMTPSQAMVLMAPAKRSPAVLRPTITGMASTLTLLPQELAGAQEQAGTQLPAHHVGPLVQQQRQVAVRLRPLGHVLTDDRLAGGPHHDGLVQLLAAGVGDDCQLGAEALDVLGLALEVALGDEQREVGVEGTARLDALVDLGLHPLPDRVAVRPDDHRPADRAVVGQLGFRQHVLVPAGEVVGLRREDLGHRAIVVAPGESAGQLCQPDPRFDVKPRVPCRPCRPG